MSESKAISFDELVALCKELDRIRPKLMTEGEVMRLASYAWKAGERDGVARGRAAERASIVAWMREHPLHPEPLAAIAEGSHVPKGGAK